MRVVTLTGQRFGHLVVKQRGQTVTYSSGKKSGTWECLCDCGESCVVETRRLTSNLPGRKRSCGCKNGLNLVGQTFGYWQVNTLLSERDKNGHKVYHCRCKCGTERNVVHSQLTCKATLSCGCRRAEALKEKYKTGGGVLPWTKPPGIAARNSLLSGYKYKAKKRHLAWELSDEVALALFQQQCHWCECEPAQVIRQKTTNGPWVYNGIDRVDSDKGYVEGNVVPCCGICNRAKSNLTVDAFLEWVSLVYSHNYQRLLAAA